MIHLLIGGLLKSLPDIASTVGQLNNPQPVDMNKIKASLADLSKEILVCYHKTARFQSVDVVSKPWNRQGQYGADQSAVLRLHYYGVTRTPYVMHIALLGKQGKVRTVVIQDSATIPASKKCQLEEWVGS